MPRFIKGFSLVELMIVVAVISILSGVGIVSYTGIRKNSEDTLKKSQVDAVAKAYEVSYDIGTASYQALTDGDFSGGKKPLQGEVDYKEGPDATSASGSLFTVCATLSNSIQYCRSSAQAVAFTLNPTFTPTPAGTTYTATGGNDINNTGGYTIHTFTSSGTFTPTGAMSVEYLVVAGGGAGGTKLYNAGGAGGGGGGGMKTGTATVTAQAYTITVGEGGVRGVFSETGATGGNGNPSSFGALASTFGGGGGGGVTASPNGTNGGSGGGGGFSAGTGGTRTAGQGNNGGGVTGGGTGGAGGGGSGVKGSSTSTSNGGAGGAGGESSISGSLITYAGGGGGGRYDLGNGGIGGSGGGGAGGGGDGAPGTAHTGGGGGGAGPPSIANGGTGGGTGGSGIVIIRYRTSTAATPTPTPTTATPTPATADPPLAGLVSYWNMDEASGATVTDSMDLNNGTSSGTTDIVAGKISNGRMFDNSTDYINIPHHSSLNPTTGISISAWVYITSLDGVSRGIVTKTETPGQTGWMLSLVSNNVTFLPSTALVLSNSASVTPDTNVWTHYVGTYDGSIVKIYKDGTLSESKTINTALSTNLANMAIGRWYAQDGYTYNFLGKIDEVGIWNRAITSTEVTSLYNSGTGRSLASLGSSTPSVAGISTSRSLLSNLLNNLKNLWDNRK